MSKTTKTPATVNNYPYTLYSAGEVVIQTNPRQLEATAGRVYLTRREILALYYLVADSAEPPETEEDQGRRVGLSPDCEGESYRIVRRPSAAPGMPWAVIEKAHDVQTAAFDNLTDAKEYLRRAERFAPDR